MQASVIAEHQLTPDVALFGLGFLNVLEIVERQQEQIDTLLKEVADAREDEEAENHKQWKENRRRIWEAAQISRLDEESDPDVKAAHRRFLAEKTKHDEGPTPRIKATSSDSTLKNVLVDSVYGETAVLGHEEARVILRNRKGFQWAMKYPHETSEWWVSHYEREMSPASELKHIAATLESHPESVTALLALLEVSSIDLMHNDAIFASYGDANDGSVQAGNDGAGVASDDPDAGVASSDQAGTD